MSWPQVPLTRRFTNAASDPWGEGRLVSLLLLMTGVMMSKTKVSTGSARPASIGQGIECRARNDRQSYFLVVRELAKAQFVLADAELSRRLWQEVADRDLSIDRITHLLYGCWFHDDEQAMVDADEQFVVA